LAFEPTLGTILRFFVGEPFAGDFKDGRRKLQQDGRGGQSRRHGPGRITKSSKRSRWNYNIFADDSHYYCSITIVYRAAMAWTRDGS
jgi:hypothetical protein